MHLVGSLVKHVREGNGYEAKHENPYIETAAALKDIVLLREDLDAYHESSKDSLPQMVEIGCYLGKNLIDFATQFPTLRWLGLDITYKRVAKTGAKIHKAHLPNAHVALCDAREWIRTVPHNTLAGVCVFFPDPWEKKKRRKHRLLQESFLKDLLACLSPSGFFWFKTDHPDYFEEVLQTASHCGFQRTDDTVPKSLEQLAPDGFSHETAFEKLFRGQNLPTFQCIFRK